MSTICLNKGTVPGAYNTIKSSTLLTLMIQYLLRKGVPYVHL